MRGNVQTQVFLRKFKLLFCLAFMSAWSALFLLLCPACSSDKNSGDSGAVQVKIPWFGDQGYTQQIVSLSTVQDRSSFHGSAARFYSTPSITQKNKLNGDKPQVHWIQTAEGFYVPTDYLSLQLVTLYAHFEKLQNLDRSLGLDQKIQSWPVTQDVGVAVHEFDTKGGFQNNNASFVSGLDAFLFLPYTLDRTPLALNPGVVGHEYFHALFNQLVIKPSGLNYPGWQEPSLKSSDVSMAEENITPFSEAVDIKKSDRDYYHEYLLRGINEGLADIWGWLYSGDPEFLNISMPHQNQRSLKAGPMMVLSISALKNMSKGAKGLDGGVYLIGTAYARSIYNDFQNEMQKGNVNPENLKLTLRQSLITLLTDLQQKVQSLKDDEYLDPEFIKNNLREKLKAQKWTPVSGVVR